MPKGMPRGKPGTPSELALMMALASMRSMAAQVDREKIAALSDEQRAILTGELRHANEYLSWLVHHFPPLTEKELRELQGAA